MLRRLGVEIKGEVGTLERFLGVAMANTESPELVARAHTKFIDAGCSVITTNNYACIPGCLELSAKGTQGRNVMQRHIQAAGRAASAARDAAVASGREVTVAGSLPPLGPSYRYDLVPENDILARDYATIAQTIAPYSQLLIAETMSCVREGVAAATAMSTAAPDLPIWVAWTLSEENDGTLRSGETIEEALESVAGIENLAAVLVNCCTPEAATVAVPRMRTAAASGVQVGVYANGFGLAEHSEVGMEDGYRIDLTPQSYADMSQQWVDDGATIVGGCCGVFDEHISELANRFGK